MNIKYCLRPIFSITLTFLQYGFGSNLLRLKLIPYAFFFLLSFQDFLHRSKLYLEQSIWCALGLTHSYPSHPILFPSLFSSLLSFIPHLSLSSPLPPFFSFLTSTTLLLFPHSPLPLLSFPSVPSPPRTELPPQVPVSVPVPIVREPLRTPPKQLSPASKIPFQGHFLVQFLSNFCSTQLCSVFLALNHSSLVLL